jgi:hypothetical protein
VVKNALDALDLPVFELQRWSPRQVLARLGPRAQPTGVGPGHSTPGKHE